MLHKKKLQKKKGLSLLTPSDWYKFYRHPIDVYVHHDLRSLFFLSEKGEMLPDDSPICVREKINGAIIIIYITFSRVSVSFYSLFDAKRCTRADWGAFVVIWIVCCCTLYHCNN